MWLRDMNTQSFLKKKYFTCRTDRMEGHEGPNALLVCSLKALFHPNEGGLVLGRLTPDSGVGNQGLVSPTQPDTLAQSHSS